MRFFKQCFKKLQNIVQTMHLTRCIAHPYGWVGFVCVRIRSGIHSLCTVCASNAWVCPMAVTEVRPKFFRQVSIVSLYCSKLHYTTRANRSADSHSLLGLVFDSFQIFLSWWIGCGEGQIFVGIIVKQHEFSKIFSFRWHNGWGGEGGGGGGCNAPPSHHQRLW